MFELHHLSAQDLWDQLQRGEVTPTELVTHYLERIERLDPDLGAFTTVTADLALERARFVEREVPRTAPLWGLPFGDKDLSERQGVRTTFGSRLFRDHVSDRTDAIPQALDDAGGISLGKTSAPEFGLPSYTESLVAPPARTPWDTTRGAGGSSGGAAVAVAAGLLPFAPGSDGGGSVRIPAAATGLVGLKPSRGLVPAGSGQESLAGLVVPGPLARSVADAAMLLDAMIGRVNGRIPHPFTLRAPEDPDGDLLGAAVRGEGRFQIGVMTTTPWDDAYEIVRDPSADDALALAVRELATMGHGLEDLALRPDPTYAPAFRTIWQAGAAGIPAEGEQLDLLEPLTRWLVERGRELSARDLARALAQLAAYERSVIAQFAHVDAVLTPALAQEPRPVGWYDAEDGERNFAQQVAYTPYTSFANVTGLPAITLPVHLTDDGLPMGVQLIGRPGGEATLLAIGRQLERRLHWQRRHPPQW
ncbi:amidase [Clavibacter michiganensis subsp. michiganensis]|uniref:amidase n=1 Tax=Clavibacter michiganensis TaxID=28447 RepID=UPI001C64D266|nr:amidase [Clavibacter michiganensis]MBW8025214.1 amidase [Clavibacter michiganensis subsp. michiganensis]